MRRWWAGYAVGCLAVVVGLGWITREVLQLEQAARRARALADRQEALRLSLWRMDSWLSPVLAREAARSPLEFGGVPDDVQVMGAGAQQDEAAEVLIAHFQVSAQGGLVLHDAPDVAIFANDLQAPGAPGVRARLFAAVANGALADALRLSEGHTADGVGSGFAPGLDFDPRNCLPLAAEPVQEALSKKEFGKRSSKAQVALQNRSQVWSNSLGLPPMTVGPMHPVWLPGAAGRQDLCFVRRVLSPEPALQGVLADWEALAARLVAEIADLLPSSSVQPRPNGVSADEQVRALAMLPAVLVVPELVVPPPVGVSPAGWTLALSWVAAVVALVAVGGALRSTVRLAEKRSRFARAVTHELRTPLTTFRLYSEMLADGMVSDEAHRQRYLDVLKEESNRLGRLVENVLAYARVEDGRAALRPVEVDAGALVSRLLPELSARATSGGMALTVDGDLGAAALHTDPEAVGQILGNLVDNACKYGSEPLTLELSASDGVVHLTVADGGPGVAPEFREVVFAPFHRGALPPGDATPGLGLGLALCRGLARDLGGDLILSEQSVPGAHFELTLPVSR